MAEMLKNAWRGWHEMLEAGKLPGLLLAVMAVLILLSLIGLKRKTILHIFEDIGTLICPEDGRKGTVLSIYAAVMLFLCICPFTAVLLMYYQTKFYDYYWVFSYVPVTIMLAAALAAIIILLWKRTKSRKGIVKTGMGTILILFVVFLCGAGKGQGQDSMPVNDYKKVSLLLSAIQEELGGTDICFWGPAEVMDSVRRVSPAVRLLYGRNVWDRALDAYSVDGTDRWMEDLYEWMEEINEGCPWEAGHGSYLDEAISHGVNVIVLSKDSWKELRDGISGYTGSVPIEIRGVYVFLIQAG